MYGKLIQLVVERWSYSCQLLLQLFLWNCLYSVKESIIVHCQHTSNISYILLLKAPKKSLKELVVGHRVGKHSRKRQKRLERAKTALEVIVNDFLDFVFVDKSLQCFAISFNDIDWTDLLFMQFTACALKVWDLCAWLWSAEYGHYLVSGVGTVVNRKLVWSKIRFDPLWLVQQCFSLCQELDDT